MGELRTAKVRTFGGRSSPSGALRGGDHVPGLGTTFVRGNGECGSREWLCQKWPLTIQAEDPPCRGTSEDGVGEDPGS